MQRKRGDVDKFINRLERNAFIQAEGGLIDLKTITKELIQNNVSFFSAVINQDAVTRQGGGKIHRIYSKQEIRDLVRQYLLPIYQHEHIVNAVSDYLYRIHIGA